MNRLARATRGGVAAAVCCVAFVASSALAASIAEDGFDYSAGTIVGQEGGTGEWKGQWQGDSDLIVFPGGYAYVDDVGNVLTVEANHVETQSDPGSPKKVDRPLNIKLGETPETFWMSAILTGSSTDSVNNVSLGDGLFLGQGGKDTGSTTWRLSDQDGLVSDTGVSADGQSFFVVRVDFTDDDEQAWMWLDPELGLTPDIADADASGTIKSFEADFIQIQLEISGSAGVDEIRVGETFADIAPHTQPTPVPEPGTAQLVGLGLLGLTLYTRRRRAASPR